jgi:hypothetical protein
MPKRNRALILGATLAAMNLAGLTAVAHAQANVPDGNQGRRPATERQAGETWREPPLTAQQPAAADAALRRQLALRALLHPQWDIRPGAHHPTAF